MIIGLISLALSAAFIPQLSLAQNKVIATYTLPDTSIKAFQNAALPGNVANDRKVLLGSVGSDLWHGPKDPPDEFWMITDRGPNGQIAVDGKNRRTFWVPEFNPTIVRVKTEGKAIRIVEAIPIVGQSGKPVTGLPNIKDIDEAPYNYSAQELLPLNPNGLDTEGLVRSRDGYFWIIEEYGPSILKVNPEGKVVKRFFPTNLLDYLDPVTGYNTDDSNLSVPEIYGLKRKLNRGFEGLGISPDDKTLYIALQSPLANPNLAAGNAARNTRILAFDINREEIVGEYVYRFQFTGPLRDDDEFDVPSIPGNTARARPQDMKISALVMLDQHRMLVLERTDFKAKVYSVDLRKATNILGTVWDDVSKTPSLETLNADGALELNGITPLPKEFVVTLDSTQGFPQKIEGITVLDGKTIAVAKIDTGMAASEIKVVRTLST
jgi:hypothetical protein